MNFNPHSNLKGKHAFLSASNYHWTNYDEDKLNRFLESSMAKERGTKLHAFSEEAIKLGRKQIRNKDSINMYINDGIGFDMQTEQVLYYSEYIFGTADAISFKKNFLRIHDLKTGVTPANMEQLRIYAALFCLEYGYSPFDIKIELRIYQSGEVIVENPEASYIQDLMDLIIRFDGIIREARAE